MGGSKKWIFYHFSANGGPSAHPCGPSAPSCLNKKVAHDLCGHGETFFFITSIPKFNILATRGQKSFFFTVFGTFRPFWMTSLPERKKNNKMKKLRILECGLCFCIFSQEGL